MSALRTYTFQVGDHSLASKRGHCTACSAVQAILTVEASSDKDAIAKANAFLGGDTSQGSISYTVIGKVTRRQMVTS